MRVVSDELRFSENFAVRVATVMEELRNGTVPERHDGDGKEDAGDGAEVGELGEERSRKTPALTMAVTL
jgi:hypothetical protein